MTRFVIIAVFASFLAIYVPRFAQDQTSIPAASVNRSETVVPAAKVTSPSGGHEVVLKAKANGHYYTDAQINNRTIEVMVDTGATVVALRSEDARSLGIRPASSAYTVQVRTANGIAHVAPVTLRHVQIGTIRVRNVPALVSKPGDLAVTLLGMAFLGKLSSVSMRDGALTLEQ